MTDPFGTERLRQSVLASWRDSPTRFREDANAEEDLYLGGYRDRLLVELAQNAADAAGGEAGALRVSMVGNELLVANTGRPLDTDAVAALASLRASAKRHGVGRFGVGFAAVLTITDAPSIVSRTGGVAFSAARTRAATGRTGRVPVLRLAWPTTDQPPDGFDTEVRLPLRDDVNPTELLAELATQATDLLLCLDGLRQLQVGDRTWRRESHGARVDIHGPDGTTRWLVVRESGELPGELTATLGTEIRPQWTICWATATTGPTTGDVLHAPTPTDERLSLPARLIATLPIEPSRRRLRPGPATDAVLDAAAATYPRLLHHLDPAERTTLVPAPDFPKSEVDERLRDGVRAALRADRWLPAARTGELAPATAVLLPTPSEDLAAALADAVSNLAAAELAAPAHATALAALDVPRLRLADVVERVTGIDRAPSWWRVLYDALAPVAETDPTAREALGGLPVPLVDGRTRPGPRGTLIVSEVDGLAELGADLGADLVHPDAAHPLLERLGARRGGAADLLAALEPAVARSVEDADAGLDTAPLRNTVLRLVDTAGLRPGEQPWLAALALPDAAGDHRRADELALPGSAFLDVLADDAPLGVLDHTVARAWPKGTLLAVGVLDSFVVLTDEHPAGPDHDLADEQEWWDSLAEPPSHVHAVRDLDLVADDAWPAALRLLATDPETWRALHQPDGYTGWWLARNALLDGEPPRAWRLPDATELAGLFDPVPEVRVPPPVLTAIGVRGALAVEDAADAEELLDRLGDPDRTVPAGAAIRAYAALATAVRAGTVPPADVRPPREVRSVTGLPVPSREAIVLNAPWVLSVVEPERVVAAGIDLELAEPLADLLDVPLATEAVIGTVTGRGEPVGWAELGAVVDACDLAGLAVPAGGPVVHQSLTVRVGVTDHEVPWWVDAGVTHSVDSTEALARALAWAAGRWSDRHTLAALLDDPEALVR